MPKATTSSTSSRKPTATSSSKSKAKKPTEELDEEDEEMQQAEEEENEEEDPEEEEGGGINATVIAETQFDQSEGKGASSKGKTPTTTAAGGKKVVAKASTSNSNNNNKRKAKDELKRGQDDESEEGGEEDKLTSREKKLKLQLEAKEKALVEVTTQFKKLSELRHTRAEESETRLKSISDERQTASANTIAAYKKEADTLRAENSSLQTTAYASPRSKAAQAVDRKVKELEQLHSETISKVEELEKEAEEREKYWQRKFADELREREKTWAEEKRQLSDEVETARNDYATEVAHSKSLQAKLKSIGPTSSSAALPSSTVPSANTSTSTSSASNAKIAQLTEERDMAIRKLQLNEDLTGFMVNSVRGADEPSYVCSLTDCWGTEEKSLNFKIVFYQDSTVGYTPDIQPERDTLLSQILPPELQSYARFDAERSGEWFKRLYTAVNKRR